MTAELLMAATIGLTAGTCMGYVVKHIQDTKYLKDMERFTEISVGKAVNKATRKIATRDQQIMNQMLKRIEVLEKENRSLKTTDFFQDIPTEIDDVLDITYLENC